MKWLGYLFIVLGVIKIGGTLLFTLTGQLAFSWSHIGTKTFWGLALIGMGFYIIKRESPHKDDPASLGRGR